MSAPDRTGTPGAALVSGAAAVSGPALVPEPATPSRPSVIELAALRGRATELAALCAGRGVRLPAHGRAEPSTRGLCVSVRPERWLLVRPPADAGVAPAGAADAAAADTAAWRAACAGLAAVIDHSSAFALLLLTGAAAREVLARGCRLDLDPHVFPPGHAAATVMAQVATVLVALPGGVLLLTPASTARHLDTWLTGVARPFGLVPRTDVSLAVLSGDPVMPQDRRP